MPSPSYRSGFPVTNRTFSNREQAISLFHQNLSKKDRNEYYILNYYGIGGQGKSALCGQFEKHLRTTTEYKNSTLAWAKVDFKEGTKRIPAQTLLSLRFQLADNGKLRFPAFDTAFARYFAITQAGYNLETAYPEMFRQPHDILQGLMDLSSEVSGIPGLGLLLKYANKAKERLFLKRWLERRGNELLQGLDSLAPYELEAALPKYFGADIDYWLYREEITQVRSVILLYDTYEDLWRDRPYKTDPTVDSWMRRIVAETPGVLHVILGREQLMWESHNPREWQDIITSFELGSLTNDDADKFLLGIPIIEADIRSRIIQSAKGSPFYLNLQVDQYEGSKRRGNLPHIDDFGGQEPELLTRFINHLPHNLYRALAIASSPRWLDESLFLDLCEYFLGGIATVRFIDITTYSFWTVNKGRYYLHALMRDYMQGDINKHEHELFKQIHQYLFIHYNKKFQSIKSASDFTVEHVNAFIESIFHVGNTDSVQAQKWISQYLRKPILFDMYLIGNFTLLIQILDGIESSQHIEQEQTTIIASLKVLVLTKLGKYASLEERYLRIIEDISENPYHSDVYLGFIGFLRLQGNYQDALMYCKVAKLKFPNKTGEIYFEMARIHRLQGELNDAKKYYASSTNYYLGIPGNTPLQKSKIAWNLFGEGEVERMMWELADANRNYMKSFDIFKDLKVKEGQAYSSWGIGEIRRLEERFEDAIFWHKQSREICKEIGDKRSEAWALLGLSETFRAKKDYARSWNYCNLAHRAINKVDKNSIEMAHVYIEYCAIKRLSGNKENAHKYLRMAKSLYEKRNNKYSLLHLSIEEALLQNEISEQIQFLENISNQENIPIFAKRLISAILEEVRSDTNTSILHPLNFP